MKKTELIELSSLEISQKESELRNELMLLRLKRRVGQMEKTHRVSQIRREIARLLTEKAKREKSVEL